MRRGLAHVVVGARSALFAPLADPGLIIIDEEHEASYKQDSSPRYHAREVAARMAAEPRLRPGAGKRHALPGEPGPLSCRPLRAAPGRA